MNQKFANKPFSPTGDYSIAISVVTGIAIDQLQRLLQAAYDDVVTGQFSYQQVGEAVQIIFMRDLAIHSEELMARMGQGESLTTAACLLLADEFEHSQTGPNCLTAIITALRDPSVAVVSGLKMSELSQPASATHEFLVTYQYGDNEDSREDYVIDATSPEEAETRTLDDHQGFDARIIAVYQRVK